MRWDMLRLWVTFGIMVWVGGWSLSKLIGWGADMLERWWR